jgi:hypothetical protein
MKTLTKGLLALSLAAGALAAPRVLAAQAVMPEAVVLSPEPGERVSPNGVFVAVSFIDPAGQLDPQSVAVRVGGVDVTSEARLDGGVLTWRPAQPLQSGPQRIAVTANSRGGGAISPATWTFVVSPLADAQGAALPAAPFADVPGTRLRGTLALEGASQSVSGAGAPLRRGEEFLPLMWLNAGGVIDGPWRYAARVHLSGYESRELQPVNRFRFDLRGPFLNLSAGDVTPVFHDLILAGRRVRGAQGELWGGPFRIAVVAGESRRAIDGRLLAGDPTVVDRFGTYGQNLFAIRPAVGSGRHFQLGLTALRVRDDVASIPDLRTAPVGTAGATQSANQAPKDNLVTGLDLTLRFAGGKLLLQYDNAISLLANDITGGPLTEAELDQVMSASGNESIGVDPSSFERYFILNASLIPLDPRGLTNVAQQARASVRAGNHLLVGEWRSIGGSYYTLGYQALQRDRQGFRLRDSFSALSDALVMSLGFERDQDNLDDVKTATTTNSTIFGTANWQQSPNGLGLYATVRVGTRTNDLARGFDGALDEQTLSLSGGTSVPIGQFSGYNTRLSLNATIVDRDDPQNLLSGSKDLYLLGGLHAATEDEESTGSVLVGMNTSELTGVASSQVDIFRLAANGRHRLTTEWSATADGSYTVASSPDGAGASALDYNRIELLGGAEYEWRISTVVGLTVGMISYTDNLFPTRDTRELIARLRVSRAF